jgi:hypothetical protein
MPLRLVGGIAPAWECVALRHQLAVLKRCQTRRPCSRLAAIPPLFDHTEKPTRMVDKQKLPSGLPTGGCEATDR